MLLEMAMMCLGADNKSSDIHHNSWRQMNRIILAIDLELANNVVYVRILDHRGAYSLYPRAMGSNQ